MASGDAPEWHGDALPDWTRPGNVPRAPRAGTIAWTLTVKEPGWYWWRPRGTRIKMQITQVIAHPIIGLAILGPGFSFTKIESVSREWAGPLPIPED